MRVESAILIVIFIGYVAGLGYSIYHGKLRNDALDKKLLELVEERNAREEIQKEKSLIYKARINERMLHQLNIGK